MTSIELRAAHRWREAIGEFVFERERVTMLELELFLVWGGFEVLGDHAIAWNPSRVSDTYLWAGVSRQFVEVFLEAVYEFLIIPVACDTTYYTGAGDLRMQEFRLAKNAPASKWQPVLLEVVTVDGIRVTGDEAKRLIVEKARAQFFRRLLSN
jgi:hypothetical protein